MRQRSEQTPHQRRYRRQWSLWKDVAHRMPLGNCTLKQGNTTAHLLWWLKPAAVTTTNAAERCGATGTLSPHGWECKMAQPLWKTVCWFLTQLNILLHHTITIGLLGIYSDEVESYVYTETWTQMFTAVLIIIAKTWKQPRYSSIGEQPIK